MPVGRFAPSPSGPLHLGSLRTAAVAWLVARGAGSAFLMRVEDLDPNVSRHGFEASQLADLAAIGVDHDGPLVRQSERRARHDEALAALVAEGLTYECYCTRREIREASTAPHVAPGTYPGMCRELTARQVAAAREEGRPAALRLRGASAAVAVVDDRCGRVEARVDDVVLRRNDGVPAYNLAVVVDDADQGVEQVVRGDDLLSVTPTQAHLHDLLGLARPRWLHVPLVLGPDGVRLAKRHGAVTLDDVTGAGGVPADVVRWIARSLAVDGAERATSVADLLSGFDLGAMPGDPVVLGPDTGPVPPPEIASIGCAGRNESAPDPSGGGCSAAAGRA